MQHIQRPHVMLLAGTESQGRAGLHSDLRALNQFPVDVSSVVTCVTAQPSSAPPTLLHCPADVFSQQVEAALELGPPQMIKVGLLGSLEAATGLLSLIERLRPSGTRLLIDPVMRSSAASAEPGLSALSRDDWLQLLGRADLITPNWDETAWLLDRPTTRIASDAPGSAQDLCRRLGVPVLLKGGHGGDSTSTDWLVDGSHSVAIQRRRVVTRTRGTGCYLASAIAARMAMGAGLVRACLDAGDALNRALRHGLPPALPAAPLPSATP